jgi:hypothetical protein
LPGCGVQIQNLTHTDYLNEAFSAQTLHDGGLALLPITAGQGLEGYRRPLGDFLNANLASAVPGGRVLTWQSSTDSMNVHQIVLEYDQLIGAYEHTAVLDRVRAANLGAALGVRYALYCAVEVSSHRTLASYSPILGGLWLNTATVAAHCLVLDLQSGDVAQEILGCATSAASDFDPRLPYEEYAQVMAEAVLMNLPGSRVIAKLPETTTGGPQRKSSWSGW